MTGLRARLQAGFTLIEVVIALALISLLMLLLTAAMHSMGQTESAIEARIEQTEDYQTSVNFLRDLLAEVSIRPLAQSTRPGTPPVAFQGNASELTWIGVMPARHGLGGRHHLRLSLEEGQLVLRHLPWDGAAYFTQWPAAQARVLVPEVSALKLSYQDERDGQWRDSWPPENVPRAFAIPSAVQIELVSAAQTWPPLVVAVRGMLGAQASEISGISFGGRAP